MTTRSYWMTHADTIHFPRSVSPPPSATVAIIGGGLAGWSAAYWLRQRGIDALVFDRDKMPSGASARNAGFLLSGSSHSYVEGMARWGRAGAAEQEALSHANRDQLHERILSRHDCDFEPSGSWRLAESEEEEVELARSLELLTEDGFAGYEWIDRQRARKELRSDRFFGGWQQSRDGALNPLKLVAAIALESQQSLVATPVLALEPAAEGVMIRTAESVTRASLAIVTLNAYLNELLPEAPPLAPVRAQVLVSAPLNEVIWQRPVYSHYGYFYFRQLPDRRLLLGGARHRFEQEEVGYDDETTSALQSELESYLSELAGRRCEIEMCWSGVMGFTSDSRPITGVSAIDPRIHLLAGFNGHGIGMAFESARRLVEALEVR